MPVWHESIELVTTCYPDNPIVSEIRTRWSCLIVAAVSVPAMIAEGTRRGSTGTYLNHLSIAAASLAELDIHFEVAQRLGFISKDQTARITEQLEEIGRESI
ncbi:four helix bundle protein [Planctomicrobium sp. SH664]|uniref:four helix bundle protein n=1 Tax=Planctomicrobium sp. SH664 TaxID=3448125 RepID=UPI003F5AF534